jgi:hypothetical protein
MGRCGGGGVLERLAFFLNERRGSRPRLPFGKPLPAWHLSPAGHTPVLSVSQHKAARPCSVW